MTALTFCSLFFLHWENTNRLKTTSTRNPLHIDPIHLSDQICQPRDVIEMANRQHDSHYESIGNGY